MRKKPLFPLILFLGLVLTACATVTPAPTATSASTETAPTPPTETVSQTPIVTLTPTATYTPTPEPTPIPTLAPGEVAPLPADESEWVELQEYVNEEVSVIIYNGEAIELGRELVAPDGEVLEGFYTWEEITTKLGFNYGIEQSGEKVKMGAVVCTVLDASHFNDKAGLIVKIDDLENVPHEILFAPGDYHLFLQSINSEGNVESLIDRGYAINQRSQDLSNNATEISLEGYASTSVTKARINPGDKVIIFVELKGDRNSSSYSQLESYYGYSYGSIMELSKVLQDGQKVHSHFGEEKTFVATGLVVPAENTE